MTALTRNLATAFVASVVVAAGFRVGEYIGDKWVTPTPYLGRRWFEPLRPSDPKETAAVEGGDAE